MKKINWILLVLVLLAIIGVVVALFWNTNKNVVIKETMLPKTDTQLIYVHDSLTRAVGQSAVLVEERRIIKELQDSVEKLISGKANVAPEALLRFIEHAQYTERLGRYEDSLSSLIDSLIILKNTNNDVVYQEIVNNKKFNYSINDKWFSQKGSFNLKGGIKIDTLDMRSEPYVIFGEKGKVYQRKTITALVGNKNPNIRVDSIQSFVYKPKPKWEISVGPQILTNLKQTSIGAGINIKKGIFSVSVGYLLPNKQ